MSKTCVVYVFIALLIVASVTLLCVKQNVASAGTSLAATLLIVFTLIPKETKIDGGIYAYSSGGGVRIVDAAAPRSARRSRLGRNLMPAAALGTTAPKPTQATAPKPTQATAPSLPTCNAPPAPPADLTDREMRDHIRNNGLYGIHGNLSCKKLQRGTVADKGLVQPLSARNQLLQFLAVDQLHAKDSYLIPRVQNPIS